MTSLQIVFHLQIQTNGRKVIHVHTLPDGRHAMIIKLLFRGLVICSWKCNIQSVADFAQVKNPEIIVC